MMGSLTDFHLGLLGFGLVLAFILMRLPLALVLFIVGLGGLWLVDGQPNGAISRLKG